MTYIEDDEGQLWYVRPDGHTRARARWITCQHCGKRAPAGMKNPGKYCDRVCGAKGRGLGTDKAKTRPDLFQAWTRDECWLAGLIWSDGCLANDRGKKRSVHLRMTDEDVMSHAARIMGRSLNPPTPNGPGRKPVYHLRIGAADAVGRIMEKGLAEQKSFDAEWPDLPHQTAFLRGLFDGDGFVGAYHQGGRKKNVNLPKRLASGLCGSRSMMEYCQEYLREAAAISPKKLRVHRHSPQVPAIQWNHRDSIRFADLIYAEGGPHMARKKLIFDTYRDL